MSMCLGDGRCRGDGGAPGGGGGAPKPLWGGRRTPTITPLPLLPSVPSVPSESRFALPAIDFALLVSDGSLVLFDFGCATRWEHASPRPRAEEDVEMRSLTGNTGSPRYMAPEVYLSQPYNARAESY